MLEIARKWYIGNSADATFLNLKNHLEMVKPDWFDSPPWQKKGLITSFPAGPTFPPSSFHRPEGEQPVSVQPWGPGESPT